MGRRSQIPGKPRDAIPAHREGAVEGGPDGSIQGIVGSDLEIVQARRPVGQRGL